MEFIEQAKYLPRINILYSEVRKGLVQLLPTARIEHIGSSSIPGAISKGDLDIFLGVQSENFNETVELLKNHGFFEKQETLRTEALCMMLTRNYKDDVAIQVVANGSEFEFFLEFRNRLRASPALVDQYNQLKRNCQAMTHDEYRDVKSLFIQSVLARL